MKIHEGVRVGEGTHTAPGGLIRCVATVRDGCLDDVAFSGDFTARPATMPADLDEALAGCPLAQEAMMARIETYYRDVGPEIPGVGPGDSVAAVTRATTIDGPA